MLDCTNYNALVNEWRPIVAKAAKAAYVRGPHNTMRETEYGYSWMKEMMALER